MTEFAYDYIQSGSMKAAGRVNDGLTLTPEEFCIVGNSSVGKSSILVQLTDKRFLGASSEPTVSRSVHSWASKLIAPFYAY